MPIRPENRDRYPPDWPQIRERILARAANRCERCGVKNYQLGGRLPDGTWLDAQPKGERALRLEWPRPGERWWCGPQFGVVNLRIVRVVLTIAHLNHTPEDCRDENLQALCQRCHLSLDQQLHQQNAAATRRRGRAAADLFEGTET
jgi:5-methylcytosine-specific restriction endonuclease McrA